MTRQGYASNSFSPFLTLLTAQPRRVAFRLAALAALVCLAGAGALAQTPGYVVTTASDDATGVAGNCPAGGGGANCSLRDALAASAASSGGNITFDPTAFATAQTITLSSTLSVPAGTTITGPGASLLTVSGNSAVQVFTVGGGVTASISGMTIAHGLIDTDNVGFGDGGGINNAGRLTLSSCTVTENEVNGSASTGSGGGIYNSGTITVDRCTFSNNLLSSSVNNSGGALFNQGTATVTNSTFSANIAKGTEAGAKGGAIYNAAGTTFLLINSTVSGNQVTDIGTGLSHGGGIYNEGGLSVSSSTVTGNTQTSSYHGDSGGGIYCASDCVLSNTILAGNTDASGTAPDGGGSFSDQGYNLVGNGTGLSGITNGVNGDRVGTSGSPIDAQLAALANYGGPTQTMIPLPGSSAICGGSAASLVTEGMTTDQRGEILNLNAGNASAYTGVGGYCPAGSLDIGAVQTDYAIQFNPVSGTVGPPETGTVPNVAMSPAPQVALTESGTPFAGSASISLTDSDADLASSPASAVASGGAATFSGLVFNSVVSNDLLTVTLPLNPSLAPPVSLTAESADFSVGAEPTTVQTPPTASAINAGQTLGSSTLSGGVVVSTITNTVVSGTWSFVNPPSTVLNATGSQPVMFTPSASYNGEFAAPSQTSVTVTVIPLAAPVAKISPSSIALGTNIYLGSVITKTVTVANVGNAAMTVSNPFIALVKGGNSNEFVMVNLCPKSLAAGKSCTMTVTFIAGPFYTPQTATLMISDSAAGSPQSVPLSATVIDPVASFNPSSLNLGTEKTNSGSASKSITVTSAGGTALSISKVTISGADAGDFTETNNCIGTFNPKATCSINVTFKPKAKGRPTATLVVTDNAQQATQSIPLVGTGN